MISLETHDDVFVIDLGDADNRFNDVTVAALHACLDEIEASDGPAALVTTASGKIWSNGLDLDYVGSLGDDFVGFINEVQRVFVRLLRLPMPTVAAIQGHVFAGGAMLALAHDVRVMRADRGYFCLPEVDLGMSFTDGMAALIAAKLSQPALQRLGVMGDRIGAEAGVALGVIDAAVGLDEVVTTAIERATALSPKAAPNLAAIRENFYGEAIEALA